MSEQDKPLNHAPWNSLTDSEKAAWDRASAKNGPRFIGGARYTAYGFHQVVTESCRREERRKQKLTY